jgi:hypothetical protein
MADVVVDRSTTGRISSEFNGNWLDRNGAQATRADPTDEKNQLAKVRVAGFESRRRLQRRSRAKAGLLE